MTKFLSIALLATAALASAGAVAQTTPAKPAPAKPGPKPTVAAHVTKTTHVVTTRSTHATTAKPTGKMVTAKLANGKTVTYNCALKGNATKQACK